MRQPNTIGVLSPDLSLLVWNEADPPRDVDPSERTDFELRLTFGAEERDPLRLPFAATEDSLQEFRTRMIGKLGERKFMEPRNRADGSLLGEIMRDGHDFLAKALTDDDLRAFTAALDDVARQEIAAGRLPKLSVYCASPLTGPFPWALLHPSVPDPNSHTPQRFLGYRFLVFASQAASDGASVVTPHPDSGVESPLSGVYGLIDDPALASVRSHVERNQLKRLAGPAFKPFQEPPDPLVDPTDDPDQHTPGFVDKVAAYMAGDPWNSLHLASRGRLNVGKNSGFHVQFHEFVGARPLKTSLDRALPGQVDPAKTVQLLFASICHSIELAGPSPTKPAAFQKLQARASITALGKICDQAASALAADFYEGAIGGTKGPRPSCGEAFHRALRDQVDRSENPHLFLFVYSGSPELRLPA